MEYLAKHQAAAADLPSSELRLFILTTHLGVADNVDFNLDWRGRLIARTEDRQSEADWGDLIVASKINFLNERRFPISVGLLTEVKLPNTTYLPYKLGTDETDFYVHLLCSKQFSGVEARLNLGLGIVGNPQDAGSQDDIYKYCTAVIFPVFPMVRMFIEAYGFVGHLGNDDKLVIRCGFSREISGLDMNLYGSVRAGGNNIDYGTAFEASEDWSAGLFIRKSFQL